MRKLRFLSSNREKLLECSRILAPHGIEVVWIEAKIDEIQTVDVAALIDHKVKTAFHRVGRPVFVEHTTLSIQALNGFPAGLTQPFWDMLQAEVVCRLFGGEEGRATASSVIGYCDGRRAFVFHGETRGRITAAPRAAGEFFHWDCIFQPDGEASTFAEMGPEKDAISMRREALDQLALFVKGQDAAA